MKYMDLKMTSNEWKISERRIRKLIDDGRIEGAIKVGNSWAIPEDTSKPLDKRVKIEENIMINLPNDYFTKIEEKKKQLDSKRPLPKETLKSLEENFNLELTYNSNAIEGNTLTLSETKVVLEGVTIGGKSMREHLETINHSEALSYLKELVEKDNELREMDIKNIHQLVLKGINDENAGKYRKENVIISGAHHIPPDWIIVPELMEKLIIRYDGWKNKYHPLIIASLLHSEFVKIHPFIDGNGRTARLLLNFEIMKNGYPPVIIRAEKRSEYYDALDKGATTGDYTDFVKIVVDEEERMLDLYLKIIK